MLKNGELNVWHIALLCGGTHTAEQLAQGRTNAIQELRRDNGKDGHFASTHSRRHLSLRDNAAIGNKTVLARIEHRHTAGNLARKSSRVGIPNRKHKVDALVAGQGNSLVDQLVSPLALNRAATKQRALQQ